MDYILEKDYYQKKSIILIEESVGLKISINPFAKTQSVSWENMRMLVNDLLAKLVSIQFYKREKEKIKYTSKIICWLVDRPLPHPSRNKARNIYSENKT